LYYYYKNKDELLIAVSKEALHDRDKHGFAKPPSADVDVRAELEAQLRQRVSHYLTTGLPLQRMLLQERHVLPEEARRILSDHSDEEVRRLASLLRLGVSKGTLPPMNTTLVALTLSSFVNGLVRWFDSRRCTPEELTELAVQLCLDGVQGVSSSWPKVHAVTSAKKRR
jgi:AcrR family transcriptional regulator